MNVLNSPLEALAFNFVSFGFFTLVNNLWTWIAVVTAAVSFWRIRAAGTDVVSDFSEHSSVCPPTPPQLKPRDDNDRSSSEEKPSTSVSVPAPAPAPAVVPVASAGEIIGVTKRKVSLYYDDDDENDDAVDGEVMEETDGGESTAVTEESEWWGGWERVLRTRMGKTGWYRYQDLTELNGNVVRLWDYRDCRRSSSERCCYCGPKRCVLW